MAVCLRGFADIRASNEGKLGEFVGGALLDRGTAFDEDGLRMMGGEDGLRISPPCTLRQVLRMKPAWAMADSPFLPCC